MTNQSGYETGLTSVTALDSNGDQNYNFAIARVRMTSDNQGSSGEALNTRVFFRLWTAPSFDTDYNPNTTYQSNLGTDPSSPDYNLPIFPLASGSLTDPSGQNLQTTPFFATSGGASDYDPNFNTATQNNNVQTIEIPTPQSGQPTQDSVWTYYGCFLDVYDGSNNSQYPGTHHCIVAQIAYDGAPIPYSTSTTTTTGNCDKLAQRNLQITKSGNPGPAATHRVPQAFDTRPSLPFTNGAGSWTGTPPISGTKPPRPGKCKECTGKVAEVVYDCFGDFGGFVLTGCCSHPCVFKSHERAIGELVLRACSQRWTIAVCFDGPDKEICEIRVIS